MKKMVLAIMAMALMSASFAAEARGRQPCSGKKGGVSHCSGDKFVCKLYVVKEGVKYVFHQAIYRKPDNQLCVTAKVVTVVTINGKLTVNFELFDRLVEQTNA